MNRKNKIIVSVVGISIVLLALLGITYAYYLTRIEGNTNTNSISITTADLSLVYGDGTTEILTSDTLLIPGEFEGTKDFTVTNNGNSSVTYGVILEDMINPLSRPDDMKITLSCSSSVLANDCAGLNEMNLPSTNEFLVENTIEVGETHTYELKLRYIEAGEDQSIDMGKTISGKVNIIDSHDTVDMTGTVASYEEGDYVQVNSEPKKSYITSEGKYKVVGLKPEQHTVAVYKKDGTLKGDRELTIKSGTTESISENEITITKDTRTITMNVESVNTSEKNITTSTPILKEYNPFNEETLAYHIYKNAKSGINGTTYSEIPLTEPGHGGSGFKYVKSDNLTTYWSKDISSGYFVYSDDYNIDANTGMYVLVEPKIALYSELVSLKGKYITWNYAYNENAANTNSETGKQFSYLYIIGDETTESKLYYARVNKGAESTESILSTTKDSYGISYYYRGGVTDNYLEFNNMCWRIVRIQGDGSVKLVLAAEKSCSSITENDTVSSLINNGSTTAIFGYSTDNEGSWRLADFENNTTGKTLSVISLKERLDSWYISSGLTNVANKLKNDMWCLGGSFDTRYNISQESWEDDEGNLLYFDMWEYEPYLRLESKSVSLLCGSKEDKMYSKIGSLTLDEIELAGATTEFDDNDNYFEYSTHYLLKNAESAYWTLTKVMFHEDISDYVTAFNPETIGTFGHYDVWDAQFGVRPAITLLPEIKILSGEGTQSNPYVVE